MKRMQFSFFKKLVILMLAVNLPLVMSISVFCYKSIQVIRWNTVKTVQTSQENMARIMETDIQYIKQQLYHISNMDDWNVLCETTRENITYDGVNAMNQFRSRFQNVLGTSRLFSDIWANIEDANLRFSVNEGIEDFDEAEYIELSSSDQGNGQFKKFDERVCIVSKNGWNLDISVNTVAQLDLTKVLNLMTSERSFENEQMVVVFGGMSEPVFVCDGVSEEVYELISSKEGLLQDEDQTVINHMILVHTTAGSGEFDIYSFVSEKDIYAAMKEFYVMLFCVLAGSILVVLSYGVIVNNMLQKPVKILLEGFGEVEKGDFSVRLSRDGDDEFAVLYQSFNSMAEKVARLIDENYVKELYAQRAVYRQLQSQINPHFLYNSFFVLQNMIRDEDNENAAEFAQSLSKYFKFITKTEQEEVRLEEETEHARTYLDIMKRRYGHRLEYQILCEDKTCLKIMVPRLILQPFIENVFMHGSHSRQKTLQILVRILWEKEDILVYIEDNGSGIDEERLKMLADELFRGSEKNDSAIFNINKRLRIKFGANYGVSMENSEQGGCRICLRMPGN